MRKQKPEAGRREKERKEKGSMGQRREGDVSRDGEAQLEAEKRDKRNTGDGKVNRCDKKEPLEICSLTTPLQTKQQGDRQLRCCADKQPLLCSERK